MDIEEVLQKIVETLKREYDPEKIILFGSYARGNPSRHSDLDLLVVKDTEQARADRVAEVSRLLRWVRQAPVRLPMDILAKTPAEVEQRLVLGDDFMAEIIEEGRVLYERVPAR